MEYKAKKEFLWYKLGDTIKSEDLINIESFINNDLVDTINPLPTEKEPVELDLNGDGVFDAKDKSIAGKVLSKGRKKRSKKTKK